MSSLNAWGKLIDVQLRHLFSYTAAALLLVLLCSAAAAAGEKSVSFALDCRLLLLALPLVPANTLGFQTSIECTTNILTIAPPTLAPLTIAPL